MILVRKPTIKCTCDDKCTSANTESVVYPARLTAGSSPSASKKGCSTFAVSFPPMLTLYFRSPSANASWLLEENERKRGREKERD